MLTPVAPPSHFVSVISTGRLLFDMLVLPHMPLVVLLLLCLLLLSFDALRMFWLEVAFFVFLELNFRTYFNYRFAQRSLKKVCVLKHLAFSCRHFWCACCRRNLYFVSACAPFPVTENRFCNHNFLFCFRLKTQFGKKPYLSGSEGYGRY